MRRGSHKIIFSEAACCRHGVHVGDTQWLNKREAGRHDTAIVHRCASRQHIVNAVLSNSTRPHVNACEKWHAVARCEAEQANSGSSAP